MSSILLVLRGPLFYHYKHRYLNENERYFDERVGLLISLLIIVLFHYLVRYFIINIGLAAFANEYSKTKKEIYQQKAKVMKKKMRKKELERLKELE